jgi:uncharacterized membrane protein
MKDLQLYSAAAAIGIVSGLRSMTAPAIVSHFAQSGALPVRHRHIEFLNRPAVAHTLAALAGAELIADKLPFIPSRTEPASAIARGFSGALSGAAVCSATNRSIAVGAFLGALGSIVGTFGGYELRKRADERFGVPDPVIAAIEDAVTASLGVGVLAKLNHGADAVTA